MRFSFHLVYRYIFCLPSRRLMQIIMQALNIIYSYCSFICSNSLYFLVGFVLASSWMLIVGTECSYVCCSASIWQHVPDSSFSLVCILQHFVSFIDILHIPHVHNSYNYIIHTYHHVPLKNSDSYNYNFYTLSSLLGNPFANHSTYLVHGQQIIFHSFLILLGLLNIIEESVWIFCFPFTTILNIPFTSLNFPVERYFIPHREGWYTPD